MKWRAPITLAAIGLIPTACEADAPTAASSVNVASTLAKLAYPARMDAVAMTYAFTTNVAATYRADPKLHALNVMHPGLVDAMVAALLREYRRARDAALPRLWARTGAAFGSRLNAVELRKAVTFFDSPAGYRIVELAIQGIASAPPPERATGNTVIYPAEPTREDAVAQAKFDATSAGQKLAAMRAEVAAINDNWSTKATPDQAMMSAALSKVIARFGVSASDFSRTAGQR